MFLSSQGISKAPVPQLSILCVVSGLAAILGGYVLVSSGKAKPQFLLFDGSAPPEESDLLHSPSLRLLPVKADWFESVKAELPGTTLPELMRSTVSRSHLPCLIALSSGTTGIPKIMPIMPDVFLKRALRLVRYETTLVHSRIALKVNSFNNQAFLHVLATLLAGGSFALEPSQATYHILTPVSFMKMTKAGFYLYHKQLLPFDNVKIVGSAITVPMLKQLRKYYRVIQTSYGSTEAGPTSAYSITDEPDLSHVGVPYPDLQVEIVDEQGRVLPPGEQGLLRIRSQTVVDGYAGDPELTRKVMRDGWFYPGDIGCYTEKGYLQIVGRDGDVLNLGGFKIHAAVLDRIIQACSQTADALVFLQPNEGGIPLVAALVELMPGAEQQDAIAAYQSAFDHYQYLSDARPCTYFFCDSIPRNDNGKPMRDSALRLAKGLTPVSISASTL